jgi:hypothetical protein
LGAKSPVVRDQKSSLPVIGPAALSRLRVSLRSYTENWNSRCIRENPHVVTVRELKKYGARRLVAHLAHLNIEPWRANKRMSLRIPSIGKSVLS